MIASRTPLRVSFFGGGTDFRDYYKEDYGCVLSTAIDQYIYAMANGKFDGSIHLNYRKTEIVDSIDKIEHPTIREGLRLLGIERGIELSALADVPAHGTGLGSSSSFIVGVLNALHAYCDKKASAETLAREACRIEIEKLGEPIGKQDQYIAAYGGFKLIKFNRDESVQIMPVRANRETLEELQSRLLFFYTGIGRKSSDVLTEQKSNISNKRDTLNKMRFLAEHMFNELNHNRFESFGELLDESWMLKKSLANGVSNNDIDRYYTAACEAGATGGKVLGAGGGGFLLFYCEKEKQPAVVRALRDLRQVHFRFVAQGSELIYQDR